MQRISQVDGVFQRKGNFKDLISMQIRGAKLYTTSGFSFGATSPYSGGSLLQAYQRWLAVSAVKTSVHFTWHQLGHKCIPCTCMYSIGGYLWSWCECGHRQRTWHGWAAHVTRGVSQPRVHTSRLCGLAWSCTARRRSHNSTEQRRWRVRDVHNWREWWHAPCRSKYGFHYDGVHRWIRHTPIPGYTGFGPRDR